jgi:Kdo2-lipid IVA lauroyltransferase/acyltransferase
MRAVSACVGQLPWRWMRAVGALLGAIAGSVLRIRRAHVERALHRAALPGPCQPAHVYSSLGAGLCEILWLAGRPVDELDGRWRFAPGAAERFDAAAAMGRGVVVATAHVGNWDLAACATASWLSRRGGALHVITKRLSWRSLDAYWHGLRAARGVVLLDARGAWGPARAALGAGGAVAMLVDQVPERSSGVATFPFLGEDARHDLAPATLAARAGAPIAVALSHRDEDGAHVLDVVDVLDPPSPRRADIVAATQRVSAAVERFVRAHPEQWLWLHRRWKGAAVRRGGQEPTAAVAAAIVR